MNKIEYNLRVRKEVEILKQQYRNDNSAFLIWFLKNIFCISEQDSIDSVCDGSRDKGIDGLWIDESSKDIYVFQSEFSPNDDRNSGDTKIREFEGVRSWFSSEQQVINLENALINLELKQRLNLLKISDKVSRDYSVNFVYVTNKIFDQNANEYLDNVEIEAYDNNSIFGKYTYMAESDVENTPKTFDLTNTNAIKYPIDANCSSIVLALPVQELLKLDGIQDHTLFSRNVRLWTGKTRVNKKIAETIKDQNEHDNFFLYHNGISIICSAYDFKPEDKKLSVTNYQVINGCQSLVSFYQNTTNLSDKMMVLTKIIRVDPQSPLIQKITQNANNQNAISAKDLKSNDRVQISLQNHFNEFFDGTVLYKIKKGESTVGYDDIIEIDYAGQLITAFYYEESHKTHLKNNFYGVNYETLFSRKMDCKKIYLAYIIHKLIIDNIERIDDLPVRGYGLARFSILRNIMSILKEDELGKEILEDPTDYIKGDQLEIFRNSLSKLFELVSLDINGFISEFKASNELFDYKNLFKNKEFCDKMNIQILTDYKKSIIRHPEDSFKSIFESFE